MFLLIIYSLNVNHYLTMTRQDSITFSLIIVFNHLATFLSCYKVQLYSGDLVERFNKNFQLKFLVQSKNISSYAILFLIFQNFLINHELE